MRTSPPLRSNSSFSGTPAALPAALAFLPPHLLAQARELGMAAGTVLFRSGDRPVVLYHVLDGELALVRHSRNGQEIVLQHARRGFLAEASVESQRYHCDGVARSASRVCALPMNAFRQALDGDPEFRTVWGRHLTTEIRKLRAQNERLRLRSAEERIVHCIEAEGVQGALTLDRPLKAWALELGLSHEALYRALARLTRAGRLARGGHVLRLAQVRGSLVRPYALAAPRA